MIYCTDAPNEPYDVCNMYVPPWSATTERFGTAKLPTGPRTIVAGDLNAYHASWGTSTDRRRTATGDQHATHTTSRGLMVAGWAADNGMTVLNDHTPTWTGMVGKGTAMSRTAPDVTFVSNELLKDARWSVMLDAGSDHLPICCDVRFFPKPPQVPRRKKWALKKAKWDKFQQLCQQIFQPMLSRINDPTAMEAKWDVATLHDVITKALWKVATTSTMNSDGNRTQVVPRGNGRMRPKPWWNDDVEKAIAERQNAREHAHESRECHVRYLAAQRKAEAVIRDAQTQEWHDLVEGLDNRASSADVFRMVKVFDGRIPPARPNPPLKTGEGTAITPEDKAEALVRFYKDRCQPGERLPQHDEIDVELQNILQGGGHDDATGACKPLTMQELQTALRKARNNKAAGPDGVPYEFLKNMGPAGHAVLLHTLNRSWKMADVPKSWRRAIIFPLLKPGRDSTECKSYRPVSLTNTIAKLGDRMAASRATQLLESKGAHGIRPAQAAYRKFRMGEENAVTLSTAIQQGFER
eukprot:gene57945-biopygen48092